MIFFVIIKGMFWIDFEKIVMFDKIVFVDFYVEWCVLCKKMKLYFDEIVVMMSEFVMVVRIDVDQNMQFFWELKIDVLFKFQVYKKGLFDWNNVGYVDKFEVVSYLK